MSYFKKDGTEVSDAWMSSITALAEANNLCDPVIMTESLFDDSRPRGRERMRPVSFKIPATCLETIDKVAKQTGISRSAYMRSAIEHALMRQ